MHLLKFPFAKSYKRNNSSKLKSVRLVVVPFEKMELPDGISPF